MFFECFREITDGICESSLVFCESVGFLDSKRFLFNSRFNLVSFAKHE